MFQEGSVGSEQNVPPQPVFADYTYQSSINDDILRCGLLVKTLRGGGLYAFEERGRNPQGKGLRIALE